MFVFFVQNIFFNFTKLKNRKETSKEIVFLERKGQNMNLRIQTRTTDGAISVKTPYGSKTKWNWNKWRTIKTMDKNEQLKAENFAESRKKTFIQVRIVFGNQIIKKYY